MEGRRVHQRHRPGAQEASGLHPRDDRGYRWILSARAGRRRCALTPAEREEISRGLATGDSLRVIAARLGRPASTVCREVNRNGGRRNDRAQKAEEKAWHKARRPKRCLLAINNCLRDLVAAKVKADWPPEQISGWLKRQYPEDEAMRVSYETIYRTLFVQARGGALKRELLAHLRSRRMMRKGRHASTRGQPRGQIKEAIPIRERLQIRHFWGGGGGILTLDTPLRGITDGSFTAVLSRPILPLHRPNSRGKCCSLLITVCCGLLY